MNELTTKISLQLKPYLALPKRLIKVFYKSISAWIDHRGASKGAALAFYTLFSMAPILILVIAIAGYFFGAEAAQGQPGKIGRHPPG